MTTFEQPSSQQFNHIIKDEWGTPRKEDKKVRKHLGSVAGVADLLDDYYASVARRNDAIAIVSSDFTERQLDSYQRFVRDKQILMTRGAYACMSAFFDLYDNPSDRAYFTTGLIIQTELIERERLGDLINYRQTHDDITPLEVAESQAKRLARLARKGADDYEIRANMLSWYRNKFNTDDVEYLQECVLEAKER
jgi:hypothetical protein